MPYDNLEFKIVLATDNNRYFRIRKEGKNSYHKFKSKKHVIPKRYGRYGVIKQERIEATSYNVGEKEFDILEKTELDIVIEKGLVGINFNF